jgi:hypothetical protein
MHVVEAGSQWPDGSHPRPFVPLDFSYACSACPELHHAATLAIVDSGADGSMMTRRNLPENVRWEHLTRAKVMMAVFPPREFELRIWHVDLSVFGVPIAQSILVADDTYRDNPVLGTDSIFRAFHIAFAWGNQPAPIMTLAPHGQVDAQPPTRWRVDARANTWEGIVEFGDPSLPAGMSVSTTEPWIGRMPRLEPLHREAPRQLDAILPNRETRRRRP